VPPRNSIPGVWGCCFTFSRIYPKKQDRLRHAILSVRAVRRSDQLTTYHHGEAGHPAWLDRPFAEAPRALEER
jgi:hypothetical protein